MVFDVMFDHIRRDIAGANREESSRPQVLPPIPFAKLWKFLLELAGGRALQELHELAQGYVRGIRQQEVDMLGGYHAGHDDYIILGSDPSDEVAQAQGDGSLAPCRTG